jgi:hypothetical protein
LDRLGARIGLIGGGEAVVVADLVGKVDSSNSLLSRD